MLHVCMAYYNMYIRMYICIHGISPIHRHIRTYLKVRHFHALSAVPNFELCSVGFCMICMRVAFACGYSEYALNFFV